MAQKKVKATLNGNNIDRKALALLNACIDRHVDYVKALDDLKAEKSRLKRLDLYTAKEIDNRTAPFKAEVDRQNTEMNNLIRSFYSRYMSEVDLYGGKDCFTCDIEGVLREIGILEGEVDDLKKSQIEKFEEMRNRFLNRAFWQVKDGDLESSLKEVKNKEVEQLVAFRDSLYSLKCFRWGERHELILKDFPKSEEQEQATA